MISSSIRLGGLAAAAVLAADQLSKWVLIGMLSGRPPVHAAPVLDLVMVWNRGVSFGLLAGHGDIMRILLIILALVISGLLARWLTRVERRGTACAIGGIIGGALSNVIDRLTHGAVADFFYLHLGEHYWPAFNLADSAICIGVAVLCVESMLVGHES